MLDIKELYKEILRKDLLPSEATDRQILWLAGTSEFDSIKGSSTRELLLMQGQRFSAYNNLVFIETNKRRTNSRNDSFNR